MTAQAITVGGEAVAVTRCQGCGGVLAESELVNKLDTTALAGWMQIEGVGQPNVMESKCPVDLARMERYHGESVPENLMVKRCGACGRWWFGGNTLARLKLAQDAKVNYLKWWGSGSGVSGLVLPVVVLMVLLLGVWVGVRMIRDKQSPVKALEELLPWR